MRRPTSLPCHRNPPTLRRLKRTQRLWDSARSRARMRTVSRTRCLPNFSTWCRACLVTQHQHTAKQLQRIVHRFTDFKQGEGPRHTWRCPPTLTNGTRIRRLWRCWVRHNACPEPQKWAWAGPPSGRSYPVARPWICLLSSCAGSRCAVWNSGGPPSRAEFPVQRHQSRPALKYGHVRQLVG